MLTVPEFRLWRYRMKKYVITTESGSDLSQEMIDRYNIKVIPMHVTMGTETYPDGSFDVQKVFDFYKETETLPKTSGSTPQDNIDAFTEVFAQYPDAHIIHIAYSAVTTVSFNSANIAAQDFDNVHLVDSKHVSIGAATIIKETAKFIENHPETSPEEIIAFVEDIRERTHTICLPETLVYLRAGGRVSNLVFYGANLLRVHPAIVLENGYLVSGKRYRGSFERCIKRMITDFFKVNTINPETVLVTGAPSLSEAHKEIIAELLKKNGVKEYRWMSAGAVISSHAGPGAIGITGIEK